MYALLIRSRSALMYGEVINIILQNEENNDF